MLSFLRAVLHRIGLQELVAVPQANVTSALTRFVIDIAKDKDKHIDRQKKQDKDKQKDRQRSDCKGLWQCLRPLHYKGGLPASCTFQKGVPILGTMSIYRNLLFLMAPVGSPFLISEVP